MSETKKTKPITPENMRALAIDIIEWLAKKELFDNVCVLVDGQMWKSEDDYDGHLESKTTPKGVTYYIRPDIDIGRHLEYSNPDTVSLTFEGPLYHMINDVDYDFVYKMSEKLLKPYGLYFEQGHAWSMSAYE